MSAEPLWLLDVSYFCHASWHAAKAAKEGKAPRPLVVLAGQVARLLEELQPGTLIGCLDDERTSWRRAIYPQYKAHRGARPDDLRAHFLQAFGLLNDAGVWIAHAPQCEADDVIATLTDRALEAGRSVVIVTADHDLDQLVSDRVTIWNPRGTPPARGEWRTEETVRQHWGVEPGRILQVKALAGDTSDGVPGVPKVGQGKALTLLERYGTVEKMYEDLSAAHELPGIGKIIAANLVAHRAEALMSLRLCALKRDCAIEPLQVIERATSQTLRIDPLQVAGALRRIGQVPTPPPGEEPPHPALTGEQDLFERTTTLDRPGPVGGAAARTQDGSNVEGLSNDDPADDPAPPPPRYSMPPGWVQCDVCHTFVRRLEGGLCELCVDQRRQTGEPAQKDEGTQSMAAIAAQQPASPPACDLFAAQVGTPQHLETIETRERILAPGTTAQGGHEAPPADEGHAAGPAPDGPRAAIPPAPAGPTSAPSPASEVASAETPSPPPVVSSVEPATDGRAGPALHDSLGNPPGQQPVASQAPQAPAPRPAVTPEPGTGVGPAPAILPSASSSRRVATPSSPGASTSAPGGLTALTGRVDPLTQEQRALRRQGITASEIGALLRLGQEWGILEGDELEPTPWLTPMDIYLNKVEGIEADVSQVDAVRFGVLLEDDVLEMYLDDKAGAWVHRPSTIRSSRWPLAIATPDALVRLPAAYGKGWGLARIVELKTSSGRWEQVPDYYVAQVHWQWAALEGQPDLELDVDQADLPRITAHYGFKYDPWSITLNENWRDRLLYLAARFWRDHVLAHRPPRLEARDRSNSLSRLHPVDTKPMVEASERAQRIHRLLLNKYLPEQAGIAEAIRLLEAELQAEIGDAAGVELGGKPLATWKAASEKDWASIFGEYYAGLAPDAQQRAIQTLLQHIAWGEAHKAFGLHKKAHKALVDKYTKHKAGSRRLLVKEVQSI